MDGKLRGNKATFENIVQSIKLGSEVWHTILEIGQALHNFQYLFSKYLLTIYWVPGSHFKPWQFINVQNYLCAYIV